MNGSSVSRIVSALAIAAMVPIGAAYAGDKYQSSVVETASNPSPFHLTKHGKIAFKPSNKPTDGGIVTQLGLKGVDCPTVDNDGGATGKCGTKGAPAAGATNHVLDLGVNFAGNDIDSVVGARFNYSKGAALFAATGKNKVGGAAFGPLVTIIYGQPLGFGVVKFRTPGSNPAACNTIPLAPGNACTDGQLYAVAGIVAGTDPDPSTHCANDPQCGVTATCEAGICTPEPCTVDADCNEGGGTGSGQCGDNGTCCDPAIDPSCTGQVP